MHLRCATQKKNRQVWNLNESQDVLPQFHVAVRVAGRPLAVASSLACKSDEINFILSRIESETSSTLKRVG